MRYERLRAFHLQGGRASKEEELFMQCGMLGWFNAWANYVPLSKTTGRYEPRSQHHNGSRIELASSLTCAVTEVLATMTWAAIY
jgi:hypothetical protein